MEDFDFSEVGDSEPVRRSTREDPLNLVRGGWKKKLQNNEVWELVEPPLGRKVV